MKITSQAKYFDGKTSKPHFVELEVFLHNQVTFYFENRRLVWNFQDIKFEKNGEILSITKKDNLHEIIKIENPETADTIYKSAKTSQNLSWYQNILDFGPKFYLTAFVSVITLIACFYIFIIPYVSEKVTDILPISFDEEIGNTSFQQIKSTSNIDEKQSEKLQEFANLINFATERKLHFKVINDEEVNAFALPDGTIVVYSGLLSKVENPNELAALLGHEATHIKERHSTKILARSIAGYAIVSLVVGDVNGIMTTLANNANELNNLSFSREFEQSADEGSYAILKQNKINSEGMYQLFKILEKSDNLEVPKILSTHPLTKDRMNYSKTLMDKNEYSFSSNPELQKAFDNLKN